MHIIIADPAINRNIHMLEAEGAAGRIRFEVEAYPMPSNPKTSALAAYSIVNFVRTGSGAVVL
ncbi:MAG: DUF108 domain-containing protein [Betaproteobacteria bacterium]|nr:DUF108 domain-containing protein [Betaproteobacteria bacterium]